MSNYGPDATITGRLIKPGEQWFWWYNSTTNGPNFVNEYYIPFSMWSLSTSVTNGTTTAPASEVMINTNGATMIKFPVKGRYTIAFSVPYANTGTNCQMWWTIKTGLGVTNNTAPWLNSLGWVSMPNGFPGYSTFSGIFNAGDQVYPTLFSSSTTNLTIETNKRFSLSVVLDYRCQ